MKSRGSARRISRIFFFASGIFMALALGATASASAGEVDQQQSEFDSNLGLVTTQSGAQTFTAGITGQLDRANLTLSKVGMPPAPVTVEIRTTDSGTPTGTVLATGVINTSTIGKDPASLPVTFEPPAAVTAGTQYALVVYSTAVFGSAAGWLVKSSGDPYAGGEEFFSSDPHPPGTNWGAFANADFAFVTFVVPAPPEPPAPPAPPASDTPATSSASPPASTMSGTGQRAAALKRCKNRATKQDWSKQRLKKCRAKARLMPV